MYKYERLKDFPKILKGKFDLGVPVIIINDGQADAFFIVKKMKMKKALILKPGTSFALGYVDENGDIDYLTEGAKVVTDLRDEAEEHKTTKIKGRIRGEVSSDALSKAFIKNDIKSQKLKVNKDTVLVIANAISKDKKHPLKAGVDNFMEEEKLKEAFGL